MKEKNLLENHNHSQDIRFCLCQKNKELRFYVDYRKLNEIIIKNRYLLFNIKELQDRL